MRPVITTAIVGLAIVPAASAAAFLPRAVAHRAAYRDAYNTANWVAKHPGPVAKAATPLFEERKRIAQQLSALDPNYPYEHAQGISASCQRQSSTRFRCKQVMQFSSNSYGYGGRLTDCQDETGVVGTNRGHRIDYHPKSVQCRPA